MMKVGKGYIRALGMCAAVGAVIGVMMSQVGDDFVSKLIEGAQLTKVDLVSLGVLIFWAAICAVSVVIFILAAIDKNWGERLGIVQMLGGGKRGRAALLPMTLFYLGNGALLALIACAKLWGISPETGLLVAACGVFFGAMMIYADFACWALLDELVRGIWIDANAITAGFILVLAMIVTLANLCQLTITLDGFHAIGAYHGLYLVVYFWLTALRAPEMLTNPMAEEA